MKTFVETRPASQMKDNPSSNNHNSLKGSFKFNELAALHENSEALSDKEVKVMEIEHDDLDEFINNEQNLQKDKDPKLGAGIMEQQKSIDDLYHSENSKSGIMIPSQEVEEI